MPSFDLSTLALLAREVGVSGTIAIVLAIGFAWKGDKWINSLNGTLKIISDHRIKSRASKAKVTRQKSELSTTLEKRRQATKPAAEPKIGRHSK